MRPTKNQGEQIARTIRDKKQQIDVLFFIAGKTKADREGFTMARKVHDWAEEGGPNHSPFLAYDAVSRLLEIKLICQPAGTAKETLGLTDLGELAVEALKEWDAVANGTPNVQSPAPTQIDDPPGRPLSAESGSPPHAANGTGVAADVQGTPGAKTGGGGPKRQRDQQRPV